MSNSSKTPNLIPITHGDGFETEADNPEIAPLGTVTFIWYAAPTASGLDCVTEP